LKVIPAFIPALFQHSLKLYHHQFSGACKGEKGPMAPKLQTKLNFYASLKVFANC